MIRVLICDDQTVVREGLAAIVSTDPEIQVVGLASHGQEVLDLVAETQPDVVLMDLKMPVMNGVQATQRLRHAHPGVYVLVLTTYADDQWLLDAIRAEGRSFLDPTIAGRVMQQAAASPPSFRQTEVQTEPLTEREHEVLRLLVQGHNNPEIARQLHLAAGTVRNYVSVILQKLGVSDRTQAAVAAVQRGLLDTDD
jgi:DNA-binding NarL/FixJ family response regulator